MRMPRALLILLIVALTPAFAAPTREEIGSFLHHSSYNQQPANPSLGQRFGTDFRQLNLQRLSFNNLDARGINFSGSNLANASFWRADLQSANFTQCDLTGANFVDCRLDFATFDRANLIDTVFHNDAKSLSARDAVMKMHSLCQFPNGNFTGAQISGNVPHGEGIILDNTTITKAMFGANYRNASIRNATISDSNAMETDFTNADFTGTAVPHTMFVFCSLSGVKGISPADMDAIVRYSAKIKLVMWIVEHGLKLFASAIVVLFGLLILVGIPASRKTSEFRGIAQMLTATNAFLVVTGLTYIANTALSSGSRSFASTISDMILPFLILGTGIYALVAGGLSFGFLIYFAVKKKLRANALVLACAVHGLVSAVVVGAYFVIDLLILR